MTEKNLDKVSINTAQLSLEGLLNRFSSTQDPSYSKASELVQQQMEHVSHDFEVMMRIHQELKASFEKLQKP